MADQSSDGARERVSVMIVDDQPPFRAAARAVVDRVAGFELVAEVASGEEAVEASDQFGPQLVLMDINMGELDGIEATRLITQANPDGQGHPRVDVRARRSSAGGTHQRRDRPMSTRTNSRRG